jgi:queuine tRNA-ribosyltransferase
MHCLRATSQRILQISSHPAKSEVAAVGSIYRKPFSSASSFKMAQDAKSAGKRTTFTLESRSGEAAASSSARAGTLAVSGKAPIQTPNYIALTSRGVVPHISPDVIIDGSTDFNGVYVAIEDCRFNVETSFFRRYMSRELRTNCT